MTETDVEALERFVSENDELLRLEEQIGRFNVFDALRVDRVEIRHSTFLAWLLTPSQSHDAGDTFLKSLLMDLSRKARQQDAIPPVSPVRLDAADLLHVEVRREWRNIDLLLVNDLPPFVIAIENKVDSVEHGDQLQRYEQTVAREFPGRPSLFVYLTRDGDEPSDDDWITYSYADLHRTLSRTRKMHAGSIGAEVGIFLDHYLSLIGSRFMENEEIDKLCRQIYLNHRQALELIWERTGTANSSLVRALRGWIETRSAEWTFITDKQREVESIPNDWSRVLPPINARRTFGERHWITTRLHIHRDRTLQLTVQVHPTTDQRLRDRIVDRITRDPTEFGLAAAKRGRRGNAWTKILREDIGPVPTDDDGEADFEPLLATLETHLKRFRERTAGVAAAIEAIVEANR